MKDSDGRTAFAEEIRAYRAEEPQQRPGISPEERPEAEKPRTSEEIVIEEISIDGMCGVY
ncbi:MAG: mycofactocin precursor MftA [Actinomycetota bacterium]